jgi:TonB family protein
MRLFLIAAFLLTSSVCFAQRQNVYFLKEDNSLVNSKDSADFIRIVSEPDSGTVLFNVVEYYPNGKRKLIGKSKTIDPIRLEGACLTFYNNGKRKATGNYEDGWLVGGSDEYYPNGRLFLHKENAIKEVLDPKYNFTFKTASFTIVEAYDSLGTVKVKEGNGTYSGYSEDGRNLLKVTEEGLIKNGKRTGIWKGTDKNFNVTFEEIYEDGELVSGKAMHNGISATYSKTRIVSPLFPGDGAGFNNYLARTIRYPAKERENNIQGRVIVSFIVEKDGALTGIKVIRPFSPGLDNEAMRALRVSPNWIPGTVYGSVERIPYSVPIAFALANE